MKKSLVSGFLVGLLGFSISAFAFWEPIVQTKAAGTSITSQQNELQMTPDLLANIKSFLALYVQTSLENKSITIDLNTGKIVTISPNADSESASSPSNSASMIFPTEGKISAGFHTGHYAIDISNSNSPHIWAVADGTIMKVIADCVEGNFSCGGGYGNHVIIDHGNGLHTLYSHLASINVKVGDPVHQGDILGKMGITGRVSDKDIHLHFEVHKNGVKEDPKKYVISSQE